MTSVRVLDLDNCISDDAWRIPLINHGAETSLLKYHAYHSGCFCDEVKNEHLFKGVLPKIAIITARPITYQQLTRMWLARHRVPAFWLFMRDENDFRPSVDVKRDKVGFLRALGVRITSAFDDSRAIIAMYRELGIPAFHQQIHEVSYE